ncbi:hypothetical protein BKA67DRAFT_225346 [Truncatella angustata]|uniref:Uncharacterized protein n=1 Tax=Truncatella angustata TaxID=152316 RepID=A0A9P8UMZ6_9PEZI|nr:uncharacterized protein BKA67DRAFT_225346 [Truncatella angustata]KAH6655063.1 hypothetical protein BKA67DRAFT_225346 [Truncatella angustata]
MPDAPTYEWSPDFDSLISGLSSPGTLGLFSCFNLVAWVLVFLFVEETRRISLEDLDFIYSVPKSKFWRYQLYEYLPWILRKYSISLFGRNQEAMDNLADEEPVSKRRRSLSKPQLYKPPDYPEDHDCHDDHMDASTIDLELRTLDSDEDRITVASRG